MQVEFSMLTNIWIGFGAAWTQIRTFYSAKDRISMPTAIWGLYTALRFQVQLKLTTLLCPRHCLKSWPEFGYYIRHKGVGQAAGKIITTSGLGLASVTWIWTMNTAFRSQVRRKMGALLRCRWSFNGERNWIIIGK